MDIKLNDEQKRAIMHLDNPMLVLAGPGSGKTTVITYRVKNLIEKYNINSNEIAVITFTKAAALEMESRFNKFDLRLNKRIAFSTFHALFFRILRNACGYTTDNILTEDEKWIALKQIIHDLNIEVNDEDEFIKDFFNDLSVLKSELSEKAEYKQKGAEFYSVFKKYDEFKTLKNKIDFDDMVTECYNMLKNNKNVLEFWQKKFKYILIDEFQDINKAQYECIKLIAAPENNIFVVGDDDQSIYKFRGSKPELILNFKKDFKNAEIITLNTNYRSTDYIIKLSEKIISNNKSRYKKAFVGTGREGKISEFFCADDVNKETEKIIKKIIKLNKEGLDFSKIAVIFRTNLQAMTFLRAFTNAGIKYNFRDNIFNIYEHWILKDILAYMDLAQDNKDNASFLRIINRPKRYISKDLINKFEEEPTKMLNGSYNSGLLKDWQISGILDLKLHLQQIKKRKPFEAVKYIRNVVPYDDYLEDYSKYRRINLVNLKEIADEVVQAAAEADDLSGFKLKILKLNNSIKESKKNIKNENAVTLSTMHSAKGLEFDAVFIPSIIEGILPYEKSTTVEEIEEERRLFYVGVTRAKSFVCLSEFKERFEKETERSRFLKEIGLVKRS